MTSRNNYIPNRNRQMQKQVYKKKMRKKQLAVQSQLTLDQLDACFKMFEDFLNTLKNARKGLVAQDEVEATNSLTVVTASIFGKTCTDQKKKGNRKVLSICQQRFQKFCLQKLDDQDRQLIMPLLNYMAAAMSEQYDEVPVLPCILSTDSAWDDRSGNDFMSLFLGSGHKTEARIEYCEQNSDQIIQNLDDEYNAPPHPDMISSVESGQVVPVPASLPSGSSYFSHCGQVRIGNGFEQQPSNSLRNQHQRQHLHKQKQNHTTNNNFFPNICEDPSHHVSGFVDEDGDVDTHNSSSTGSIHTTSNNNQRHQTNGNGNRRQKSTSALQTINNNPQNSERQDMFGHLNNCCNIIESLSNTLKYGSVPDEIVQSMINTATGAINLFKSQCVFQQNKGNHNLLSDCLERFEQFYTQKLDTNAQVVVLPWLKSIASAMDEQYVVQVQGSQNSSNSLTNSKPTPTRSNQNQRKPKSNRRRGN